MKLGTRVASVLLVGFLVPQSAGAIGDLTAAPWIVDAVQENGFNDIPFDGTFLVFTSQTLDTGTGLYDISGYFDWVTSGVVSANTSSVKSRAVKKIPIMFSKKIKPDVRSGNNSSFAP